jgi:hypothetical protein
MKPAVEKLAFLLAASGLSDRVIADAIRTLRSSEVESFLARVRQIRRGVLVGQDFDEREFNREASASANTGVADQIVKLLVDEAHLSPSTAVELLLESFVRSGISRKSVPLFRPKEGLKRWVLRLPLQSSELLHHASKIRNEIVHIHSAAWPLRERK